MDFLRLVDVVYGKTAEYTTLLQHRLVPFKRLAGPALCHDDFPLLLMGLYLTLPRGIEDGLHQGTLSTSFFPSLPIGERQAISTEGAAELLERLWPYAMELFDLGLAELG